jgi:hypothetical protein
MILDKDKIVATTVYINDARNNTIYGADSRCYDNKASIITNRMLNVYYVYENGAVISPDRRNPLIDTDAFVSFDNPFDAYNYFQEVLDNQNDQQQQQQQQDQQRKDARIPFIRINANGDGKLYTCDGNFENVQDENENVQVSNFDINALTQKDISMQVQGQDLIGILIKYEPLDLSQDEEAFFFLPTDAGSNQNQQQGGNPPPQGGNPPPQGGNPPPQGGNPPPQGGNPPPQGGNPPPQGGNPPPQGGNPPPQGGNPPPQGGNPPPQGGNPPPQGGNPPPQGGNPPPQGGNPPPQGQQNTLDDTPSNYNGTNAKSNSNLINGISQVSGVSPEKVFSYFERNLNMAELFLQNTNFVEIQKALNTNESPRDLAKRINQAIKDDIITIE